MNIRDLPVEGVKIIEPQVLADGRGWFCEQYSAARYRAAGIAADFVQDNESLSSKGVVRGLHWQAGECAQAKLVRVIRGAVWDVAVDIRKGSSTFGQWISGVLCAADSAYYGAHKGETLASMSLGASSPSLVSGPLPLQPFRQLFIPRGFAHGFVVLEDDTLFSYKCDNLYCKASERGLLFDDPALGVKWPSLDVELTLSEKDRKHPGLKDIEPWEGPR